MIFKTELSRKVIINGILLLLFMGFSYQTAVSRGDETIRLDAISQRKVRNYLVSRDIAQMTDFSLIHSSWKEEFNKSDFNIQEKEFYLDYDLSSVWESYRHVNAIKMWNGKSVRFGVLLSKPSNTVVYEGNTSSPEIDTGQVYFLNLRMIRGLVNIPVAFEIINIDQIHQLIEFSYIDSNKSKGKQTIQFFDNGDGRTRIAHTSYFKSGSHLRDNLLYPWFHNKFIKEFHGNMRQLMNITAVKESKTEIIE
jgi:hypothetical protein